MVWRTVPILVRIARSSVDGRPIRTTCGTDQQVIRTGVDGALVVVGTSELNRYHRWLQVNKLSINFVKTQTMIIES